MQDGEALLAEFVARKIQVQGLKTHNLIYEAEIFLVSYFYLGICEFLYMLQKNVTFSSTSLMLRYATKFSEKKNEYKNDSKTYGFHISSKQFCQAELNSNSLVYTGAPSTDLC